ncbi:small acid-soluble spore protein C (minor alpha/beta-type SASP) [Anoxybacillus vitaminiphilus]|uniref:Small acid-soluble spore protein C (Minor alpha/beta-type SASP) n=2 Tax=Paranoxybacillus vitaminiphilus TaxID=581036 RepID=A0A327YBF9_9BACL|nr:small acid-soluble spore protein C (minor alpha/beta-type SASP) [Anoxybacillus vitaminiphilus]
MPMQQQNQRVNNSNEILIPDAAAAIEQMKYEIAREFGVELGPDTSSRANGSVGGEITKRLVLMAQQKLQSTFQTH